MFIFVFSTYYNFKSFFHFYKSVDSVLGIRTRGGKMEGTDESIELERHSKHFYQWRNQSHFVDKTG